MWATLLYVRSPLPFSEAATDRAAMSTLAVCDCILIEDHDVTRATLIERQAFANARPKMRRCSSEDQRGHRTKSARSWRIVTTSSYTKCGMSRELVRRFGHSGNTSCKTLARRSNAMSLVPFVSFADAALLRYVCHSSTGGGQKHPRLTFCAATSMSDVYTRATLFR